MDVPSSITSAAGSAASALGGVAATATAALPTPPAVDAARVVDNGSAYAQRAATSLHAVERPVAAAANGVRHDKALRVAGVLSKGLSIFVIGTGAFNGARIHKAGGAEALVHTRHGRAAVLSATAGTLLLSGTPPAQLLGAGVLAASAANFFGGLDFLDRESAKAAIAPLTRRAPAGSTMLAPAQPR